MSVKSGMQKIVALSVAEAEVTALVMCVQEMMYIKKLIESIELIVMLPMLVQVDNKTAVDLVNGWTVGGNMKHSEVRLMYLRELKKRGIIRVEWHPTDENESDIMTKNVSMVICFILSGLTFQGITIRTHIRTFTLRRCSRRVIW